MNSNKEPLQSMGEILRVELPAIGVHLSGEQLQLLLRHAGLVLEANRHVNLTRIEHPEEFAVKHIIDSLCCLQAQIPAGPGIDVGTGAGYPGIPLAVAGGFSVTLVDSLAKKVRFLQDVIERMELEGVQAVHGRAEDVGRHDAFREAHRWAVARAVGPLPVLLEYMSPLVAVGGLVLCMKGPGAADERIDRRTMRHELGLAEAKRIYVRLPRCMGERYLMKYEKVAGVKNRYPRKAGVPTRRPL